MEIDQRLMVSHAMGTTNPRGADRLAGIQLGELLDNAVDVPFVRRLKRIKFGSRLG